MRARVLCPTACGQLHARTRTRAHACTCTLINKPARRHAHCAHTPRPSAPCARSYQPLDPAAVCLATLAVRVPVSQLALSADQLGLACVCHSSVSFFSVAALAGAAPGGGPLQPLVSMSLQAGIKQ